MPRKPRFFVAGVANHVIKGTALKGYIPEEFPDIL